MVKIGLSLRCKAKERRFYAISNPRENTKAPDSGGEDFLPFPCFDSPATNVKPKSAVEITLAGLSDSD
jgi:hypothetical protein